MEAQERIRRAVEAQGYTVREWRDTEDGQAGSLGRFRVVEGDDDNGPYTDDEGELLAIVVGAEEFRNVRVAFSLSVDEYGQYDVTDFDTIEAVD